MTENVKSLISKAEKAEKSEDAMRFSQAAVNAANALSAIFYLENHEQLTGMNQQTSAGFSQN